MNELQLKFVIHNEVLLITTKAESDDFMLTRFYSVKDLILVRNEQNEIQTDFQPLIDLIVNTVSTKSWVENGGNGVVCPYQFRDRCLLAINQTQVVHEMIDDLLASLRHWAPDEGKDAAELHLPKLSKRAAPTTGPAGSQTSAFSPPDNFRILTPETAATAESQMAAGNEDSSGEAKIRKTLGSPTEIDFKETPLKDVIEYLKDRHKIEIQLDAAGLKDAGVDPETPVTKHLSGISLRAVLRLLLDELQLKCIIHHDVLLITSPQKADSDDFMSTIIYPVKDLVLVRNANGEIEADFQPLQDLITNSVAAKTWQDNGGNGTISTYQFKDRCLLVIDASPEEHEQIAVFLAALRRCGAAKAKKGGELQLSQRLKTPMPPRSVAPTAHSASSPPPAAGGGYFWRPSLSPNLVQQPAHGHIQLAGRSHTCRRRSARIEFTRSWRMSGACLACSTKLAWSEMCTSS